MRIVSVNVGLPRQMDAGGREVMSGIFKSPVEGRTRVRRLNLDGDRQADLSVHGGPEKAVYAYPCEHYPFWRKQLGRPSLPPGSFGENLTVEGLNEETIHIGDQLRMGTAELVVVQPRMPCFKLAGKFERPKIVKEMLDSGYSGLYLAVLVEGEVAAGDAIEILLRDPAEVSIADLNRLLVHKTNDEALMRRAIQVEALAAGWRQMLADRLEGTRS
jgi:MOSC domain-containing protein YiiM